MSRNQYRAAAWWLAFAAASVFFGVPAWALAIASLTAFGCAKVKTWGAAGTGRE